MGGYCWGHFGSDRRALKLYVSVVEERRIHYFSIVCLAWVIREFLGWMVLLLDEGDYSGTNRLLSWIQWRVVVACQTICNYSFQCQMTPFMGVLPLPSQSCDNVDLRY